MPKNMRSSLVQRPSTFTNACLALVWLASICSLAVRTADGADAIETIGAGDPDALKAPVVAGAEIWKDPAQLWTPACMTL